MKNMTKYLIISLLFTAIGYTQNYEFGVVNISGNTFKVVAIPDFNTADTNPIAGNVDIADVGFTLMLPAGASDIQNVSSILSGRTWNLNSYDAAFLSGIGLGDGTKDAFLLTMNPGQSLITHVSGSEIDLVSFEVVNPPTSGDLYFLENTDPIAQGAGSVLDSFFNADIDGIANGAGTVDYYEGNDPSLDSYSFGTLSVNTELEEKIKIYPNPATTVINLQVGDNILIEKIELFNVEGKHVLTQVSTMSVIDVNKVSRGVYFLRITTVSNGAMVKKVILE